MDETAIAFELPHARASATHVGPPLDRISVRDYTRSVEIGAFRSERGVTQRIRFNVVLEVAHHSAAQDDDVDKVISYDTITEAIEAELAAERINLLETLAERVAARCLADRRAVRVFVRIEKLDRIPGALGVEIVRTRTAGDDPARSGRPRHAPAAAAARALVVHLPAAEAAGPRAALWRDALAALRRPLVVCRRPARRRSPRRRARPRAASAFSPSSRPPGPSPTATTASASPRPAPSSTGRSRTAAARSGRRRHMVDRRPAPARPPMRAPRPRSPPGSPTSCSASLLVVAGTAALPTAGVPVRGRGRARRSRDACIGGDR